MDGCCQGGIYACGLACVDFFFGLVRGELCVVEGEFVRVEWWGGCPCRSRGSFPLPPQGLTLFSDPHHHLSHISALPSPRSRNVQRNRKRNQRDRMLHPFPSRPYS